MLTKNKITKIKSANLRSYKYLCFSTDKNLSKIWILIICMKKVNCKNFPQT